MTKIRLVVFDNNGTLLDDLEALSYPSVVKIFETFGLRVPTLDEYRNEIGADFMQFYRKHGFSRLSNVTAADLNKIRKAFYEENKSNVRYLPSLEHTLRILKTKRNLKLSMVTAEIDSTIMEFLSRDRLDGYFDDIRSEAWPKPPALVRTLVFLGVMPEEAVYVDDTVDGIKAAKTIGMRTIGIIGSSAYNSASRIAAVKPDWLAESFKDVPDCLKD